MRQDVVVLRDPNSNNRIVKRIVAQGNEFVSKAPAPVHRKLMRLSDVVQLNVGGVHFTTTKSTLSAEPRSMLAAMCAPGRAFGTPLSNKSTPGVAVGSPHATGPVPVHFLDRCGERFKHVLKCVRPAGALSAAAAATVRGAPLGSLKHPQWP